MKQVLSFGGGVQTTALAILVAQGEVEVDEVVFADTGGEKPETYWYMESYTLPLLTEVGIPFATVRCNPRNLVEHCSHYRSIPSVSHRWCSAQKKVQPILDYIGHDGLMLIGFSADESHRANRAREKWRRAFPLLERGITGVDCQRIISEYGWPVPVKSSCFFCPFQSWVEWNWLKLNHPELIEAALEMERHFYTRRPDLRDRTGLFGGKPLWKWAEGNQPLLIPHTERTCWSGHCGH